MPLAETVRLPVPGCVTLIPLAEPVTAFAVTEISPTLLTVGVTRIPIFPDPDPDTLPVVDILIVPVEDLTICIPCPRSDLTSVPVNVMLPVPVL